MMELKTCPFCGGEAVHDYSEVTELHAIYCGNCGCITPCERTEEEAVAIWNARAERTCAVSQGYVDEREMWYECTECGLTDYVLMGEWTLFNYGYCPNCGAKVVD